MKRRFNYTGRGRIPREKISIILNRDGNSAKSFSANIDLTGMNFPPDAKVYVEAYHRTEVSRYDFGTAENILPDESCELTTLAYGENLKFRILVVDETEQCGLILAHADRIKIVSEVDKKPILPVDFRDIGQQIYLVEFTGDEGSPVLIINSKIPNIENIARSDPQFIMHVYPTVIKEVLTHMIFVDGIESFFDPPIDWHRDWLKFSERVLPIENPPEILNPEDTNFEAEDVESWVNRVVEEFCASRSEWSLYISQLMGEGT